MLLLSPGWRFVMVREPIRESELLERSAMSLPVR